LSFGSPAKALSAAEAGLKAAHELFEFIDATGKSSSLAAAMVNVPGTFETGVIKGGKAKPAHGAELEVPYKGRVLKGQALLDQLTAWQSYGTIEPTAADAIAAVVRAGGKWVDLSDRYVVMLGAGSAMGPYPLLMALGANVIALDLNMPRIWERLFKIARDSCGTVYFPLAKKQAEIVGANDTDVAAADKALAAHAGANLLEVTPQVARWLTALLPDKEFTVGSYVYLDGEAHVRLVLACDAITSQLIEKRAEEAVAGVPVHADRHSRDSARRLRGGARAAEGVLGGASVVAAIVHLFSKKMLASNVQPEAHSDDGSEAFTYVDAIVVPQGPNYALAKRMQHWRAMLARDAGCVVSSNIAPSTSTVSVVKNRSFAWAYEGVPFFKPMEIFEPETSHAVMTAILLYDLNEPRSVANPKTKLRNPLELFASGAFHGGVWRMAYTFGSTGEVSVLVALLKYALPYVLGAAIVLYVLWSRFIK
jgi:hypothetical protein